MLSVAGALLVLAGSVDAAAAESEQEPGRVRASVGEQGRDLTPRFAIQGDGRMGVASLELRAAFGEEVELIGPTAVHYRMQPEIMWHSRAIGGVRLITGGGVGSTYIVEGVCSPTAGTRCVPVTPSQRVELSFSGAAGVRFEWLRVPMTAMLRADALASREWTAMARVGIDIPGAD